MKIFKFPLSINKKYEAQPVFDKIELLIESARSLFSQSEELKKVVSVEKNAVEKSSSASHEISSMVATTAEAAIKLSQTAIESNNAVQESTNALQKLSELVFTVDESSRTLQASVKNGLKEISSITETMTEIRSKSKMINEVVFQTKLLSFNASVEAARAGEHGKGFAVVAQEMGQLAKASGEASREIESILNLSVEKTQNQINQVTKELEKVALDTVNAINSVSSKVAEISILFEKLKEHSKSTEAKAHEISQATAEQKIGVDEISESLQNLEVTSHKLDEMAISGNKNASDLALSIEEISRLFMDLSNSLQLKVIKNEKPFDFKAAIKAHIDWKMKLSNYLEKPDGSLEHSKVCLDNACALGKWLYADGEKFKNLNSTLYEDVRNSHAEFHKAAAEIVQNINNHQFEKAKQLLGAHGKYLQVSEKTVHLIQRLQQEVDDTYLKAS